MDSDSEQPGIIARHARCLEDLGNEQRVLYDRLAHQEQCLTAMSAQIQQMSKMMSEFIAQAQHPAPAHQHTQQTPPLGPDPFQNAPFANLSIREPKLQMPNCYDGKPGKCRNFLAQVDIFFKTQPSRFVLEEARIGFILSLLTGSALDWVGPLIRSDSAIVKSREKLESELISVFDHDVTGQDAATRLMHVHQGKMSVAEFSILFRSMASETGWQEPPLMTLFVHALSESVRDALATVEPPKSFDLLVQTAIRIDNRLRERDRERQTNRGAFKPVRTFSSHSLVAPLANNESISHCEPMQVDGAMRYKSQNVQKRKIICFHCNKPGHIRPRCPLLKGNEGSP